MNFDQQTTDKEFMEVVMGWLTLHSWVALLVGFPAMVVVFVGSYAVASNPLTLITILYGVGIIVSAYVTVACAGRRAMAKIICRQADEVYQKILAGQSLYDVLQSDKYPKVLETILYLREKSNW
jgi:hypothetical protein